MPYNKEHKEKSRNRILASAARLFPRLGYEAVSIDMLMSDAGLTRGAFYAHFANKAELYSESMLYTAHQSAFTKFTEFADDKVWFDKTIAAYLSREHLDHSATPPCPLAFLVNDINRGEEQVRATYSRLYREMVALIQQRQAGDKDEEAILAATAMMIGGVAIAKALSDRSTSDKLLRACRRRMQQVLNID